MAEQNTICDKICNSLKTQLLFWLNLVGVIVGIIAGISLRQTELSDLVISWIGNQFFSLCDQKIIKLKFKLN